MAKRSLPRRKKTTSVVCNGTQPVQIKTLHGSFCFEVQRYQLNGASLTYFDWTEQVFQGYSSQRLQEFVAYYSNRMSYAEVEKRVARYQGQHLVSDQGIWNIVTAQAERISEQLSDAVVQILDGYESDHLQVNCEVDIYDPQEEEILIFEDGIQVKGQSANRRKRNRTSIPESLRSEEYAKAPRVNTDVVMLEKSPGEFEYMVAPLGDEDNTRPSLAEVVKANLIEAYGSRDSPLNIVAITEGARTIRLRLLSIFCSAVVIILDWYHLGKKVRDLMSMIARNKQEKSEHVTFLLSHLWRGDTEAAIEYLQHQVHPRNPQKLHELIGYLHKHETEIINYERRQKVGKPIGSGRAEKGVDQVVGYRQKKKGMSWSSIGSHALAILKVVELNGQWQQLWSPKVAAA